MKYVIILFVGTVMGLFLLMFISGLYEVTR